MEQPHWDVFLAHAAVDVGIAEKLYDLLKSNAKVFLDSKCLLLGDDWDTEISQAQRKSTLTVVLISLKTDTAYYQREETARAIDMSRSDKDRHRVVPLFLDSQSINSDTVPYGLLLKHGLKIESGNLHETANKLLQLLNTVKQDISNRFTISNGNPLPLHNLPGRTIFVDRESEKAEALLGLNSRKPIVTIEGLGGMGKTVLALEIAYECLEAEQSKLIPPFDACVYISAKNQISLNDLIDTIAHVLNYPYLTQLPLNEKPEKAKRLLRENRTMILADNLETVTDLSFLEFLQTIPEPSKVLVTTRDRDQFNNTLKWRVNLDRLKSKDAIDLVRLEATALDHQTIAKAGEDELMPLVQATGGNPLAIETTLGLFDAGVALDTLISALTEASQQVRQVFDEIFPRAWAILNSDARHILMLMSFFEESASKLALRAISGLDTYSFNGALSQLMRMALIAGNDALEENEQRFTAHPLTLAYAKIKSLESVDWNDHARRSWVEWYVDFAIQNIGGDDWWEGLHEKHQKLDTEWKNIIAVFKWCKASNLYLNPIRKFWLNDSLSEYTKIYGYWSDQVDWLRWIIATSNIDTQDDKESKQIAIAAISGIVWALSRTGNQKHLDEANELVKVAWGYISSADPMLISRLADDTAVLNIQQKNWEDALTFFDKSIASLKEANADVTIIDRKKCHIMYYQGVYYLEIGKRDKAEQIFRVGAKLAEEGRWQRALNFYKNRLGDIAVEKGNISEAENFLNQGLAAAEGKRDKRSVALFKYSMALLEQKRGNLAIAIDYAQEALNGFIRLGMERETHKAQSLLKTLPKANY